MILELHHELTVQLLGIFYCRVRVFEPSVAAVATTGNGSYIHGASDRAASNRSCICAGGTMLGEVSARGADPQMTR